MALPHGCLAVLYCWQFKMRLWYLQDFIGLVCFESRFLFVHPCFLLLLCTDDSLTRSAEVVTYMIKINQVADLRAKFLFHLIGYPRCTVAHAMNWCACGKPGLHSTVKQAVPGGVVTSVEIQG